MTKATPASANAERRSTSRTIALGSYEVLVAPGALERVADIVERTAAAHRYAVVSDDEVAPRYADRAVDALGKERKRTYVVPSGETHKTRGQWAAIPDAILVD